MITIGEMAKQTGISIGTIRFYEKKGILEPTARDENNRRLFDDEAVHWLQFVKYLREADMSLQDIQNYRRLIDLGEDTVNERITILENQRKKILADIAAKKQQLSAIDHKLSRYREGSKKYL